MNNELPSTCANCNHTVDGKYCCNCGHPVKPERIDFHYLLHEAQHTIFHVDKGILYTIKELIVRPGITLQGYLAGKRINHFKPFAFVLMLGAFYGFLAHFFNLYPEDSMLNFVGQERSIEDTEYYKKIFKLVYDNYSFTMLALVPFAALSSFIIFRKHAYNYCEHLVINSYITGMQIFILLIFYFMYIIFRSGWVHLIGSMASYMYIIGVYIQLFNVSSKIKTGLKAFLSIIFSTSIMLITVFIITFVVMFIINISSLL